MWALTSTSGLARTAPGAGERRAILISEGVANEPGGHPSEGSLAFGPSLDHADARSPNGVEGGRTQGLSRSIRGRPGSQKWLGEEGITGPIILCEARPIR